LLQKDWVHHRSVPPEKQRELTTGCSDEQDGSRELEGLAGTADHRESIREGLNKELRVGIRH